jgi:hypothetical protein
VSSDKKMKERMLFARCKFGEMLSPKCGWRSPWLAAVREHSFGLVTMLRPSGDEGLWRGLGGGTRSAVVGKTMIIEGLS